jgi:hypothetical protein
MLPLYLGQSSSEMPIILDRQQAQYFTNEKSSYVYTILRPPTLDIVLGAVRLVLQSMWPEGLWFWALCAATPPSQRLVSTSLQYWVYIYIHIRI